MIVSCFVDFMVGVFFLLFFPLFNIIFCMERLIRQSRSRAYTNDLNSFRRNL